MIGFRRKILQCIYWCFPFCFYAAEANAWGLVTHVYYAHSLLWAMPLLDPRLQRAIKAFPELVMTGACLPDLAVVSARFSETHQWHHTHQLLATAQSDEEIALAIGYISHLYVDVIAHNHFVPAHEIAWLQKFKRNKDFIRNPWLKKQLKDHFKLGKWFNHSAITHLSSEWAMDAHLAKLAPKTPSELLSKHRTLATHFVKNHFQSSLAETETAISRLTFWDNILRKSRLPHLIYALAKTMDKQCLKHFVYYVARTQNAMHHIGLTLNGKTPSFEAEPKESDHPSQDSWGNVCLGQLHLLHPQPIVYFDELN